MDSFLASLQARDRTRAAYRADLSRFADYLERLTPDHVNSSSSTPLTLTSVDFATINDYFRQERASGAKDATINHRLSALRSFFGWCVKCGYLAEDPSENVDFRPVKDRAEAVFLDASELDRLLQTCDRNTVQGKRNYTMLRVMVDCGLRVSELCDLDIADLDFERGALFVKEGKGGKTAWVYFDNERRKRGSTRTALKEWLAVRPLCGDREGRQPLFVTRTRTRFTSQSVWVMVKEAARRARLPREKAVRITPHALRHSYVTKVWEKTGDIALTAKAARHSSPHTTLAVYTHIRDARLKETAVGLWE